MVTVDTQQLLFNGDFLCKFMEDLFDLSNSEKEEQFIKHGLAVDFDVAINIIEVFSNFPFISSMVKLGMLGNKYLELRFVRKISRFLQQDVDIPNDIKKAFFKKLTPKERKKIHDYILQYLFHAEDEEKADIMGCIYKECLLGNIDKNMLLRLCSIVNNVFLDDLRELPNYVKVREVEVMSISSNNFINLGLINNELGGIWQNSPTLSLNEIGLKLYDILNKNNWFSNH